MNENNEKFVQLECPCCKGKGMLLLHDLDDDEPYRVACAYCSGRGSVEQERERVA